MNNNRRQQKTVKFTFWETQSRETQLNTITKALQQCLHIYIRY